MNPYGGLQYTSYGRGSGGHAPRCSTCGGTGREQTEQRISMPCQDCNGTGLLTLPAVPWWVVPVVASAVGILVLIVWAFGNLLT